MSTEEERLDILIRAKTDQYLRELNKAERATRGFTDGAEGRLKRLASNGFKAAAVAAGALSVAVVGIGVKAVKTAAQYEQALTNALSITGLVGEEMEVVREQADKLAKQLGRDTAFSAQEAANAMYDLASKGYEVSTWAEVLPGILNLASATQADLAETTDLVTSTINQFNMAQSESTRVADVYTKAISASAATQDKLALSMRYVGPVASALGWRLEEAIAVLGRLYDAGFRGEQAGTAMRQVLLSIQDPASDAAALMDRFGISAETLSEEQMPGLIKRLSDGEATAGDVAAMFGKEAAPAILALIKAADDPKKTIGGLTKDLEEAGGTAEQVAKQQLDTLEGQWTILKGSMEGVAIAIGETVLPAFKDLVSTALVPATNAIGDFFGGLEDLEGWEGADLGGKIRIAWDELTRQFEEWFSEGGEGTLADMSAAVGKGLVDVASTVGATAAQFLLGVIGLDDSTWGKAGRTIAAGFLTGIAEGIVEQIWDAAMYMARGRLDDKGILPEEAGVMTFAVEYHVSERTAIDLLETMGKISEEVAKHMRDKLDAGLELGEPGKKNAEKSGETGGKLFVNEFGNVLPEIIPYYNSAMNQIDAAGTGRSDGQQYKTGFVNALSNIDTLIEEKLYMRGRAARAGESAAGSAEGGGVGAGLGSATGNALVSYAKRFLGVPYKWGGTSPKGFDCSGLMQYVHRQFGISIPRVSRNQYKFGRKVSSPLPGDMVFFGSPIHHVGMYAGGGKMVEAPYTGARVRVSNAFRRDYAGAATYLYDKGGLLPEGMTTILNASGAPEIILPGDWIERLTTQVTQLVDAIRAQVNADKEVAKGFKGVTANKLILELFGNRSSLAGSYVSREASRLAMQQATGADLATQTATLMRQIEFIDKATAEARLQLDVAKSRGMDPEEINRLAESLFDLERDAADARQELEALARVPLEQAAARWNTAIGQTQMLMDLLANSSSAYGLQTRLFPELMGQLGGGYQTALDLMNASTNPADIMGYADQALTGLSSMFAAEKAQLDRALDATLASIDGSQDDYERAWQARSDALDEEIDRERDLLNEQYNTQRDALRKQLENLQKAQRDELNALNKFYEDKLRLLDDREREITRADEKRSRQKSIASKEARLRELLGQEGKTYADVQEIERLKSEIQEGRDELARAEAAWEREDQRLALQREREQAIERLELQHELQTTALRDQIEADEKRLEAQHKAAQKRLDARRDELERERQMMLGHFDDLRRQAERAHQAEIDAAVEKYRALMQEVIDQQNALLGEQTDYYNAGYALGKSFADGVLASLPLIEAAGLAAADALSRYLELHSPADMGPLASLDTWFEKFIPTLLEPFNPPAAVQPIMDTAVPTTRIVHEHRITFDGDATGIDVHELAREVGQIIGHEVEVRRYGY